MKPPTKHPRQNLCVFSFLAALDGAGRLCYNVRMKAIGRRGQTMVEYVLTFCALLAAVGALGLLLHSTKRAVVRTERLVSSDYP